MVSCGSQRTIITSERQLRLGKTGTTDEAGSCLCLLAKDKYGDSHVSIILNAGDKETLYAEMNKLLSKINN